jgi:hypothetical protein
MKCALELVAINAMAKEEYRLEEERKDAEARKAYETRKERTIIFCEEYIAKELENQAKHHYVDEISTRFKAVYTEDRLGNKGFQLVKEDGTKYANGDKSYRATGDLYDFGTMVEYLKAHCINVETYKGEYKEYMLGIRKCVIIKIFI